jgi:hypothetical protein
MLVVVQEVFHMVVIVIGTVVMEVVMTMLALSIGMLVIEVTVAGTVVVEAPPATALSVGAAVATVATESVGAAVASDEPQMDWPKMTAARTRNQYASLEKGKSVVLYVPWTSLAEQD